MRPLVATRGRPAAAVAIAVGAAVAVVLAVIVWHGTTTSFDTWVFERGYSPLGPQFGCRRRMWLLFSEPVVSILVPIAIVVWAAVTRQRNLAVFAAVGPLVALGVTELIGKPLVDRLLGPGVLRGSTAGAVSGAYPSGHETGLVSWLLVGLLVVFRQTGSVRWRVAALVVAVVWAVLGAFGLTMNYYHYATDTIGAMGLTVAVVLGVALLFDRYTAARGRVGCGGSGRQLTWRS